MADYSETVLSLMQDAGFVRGTFAGPQRLEKSAVTRVAVRRVDTQGKPHLMISLFDAKQDRTKNVPVEEAGAALAEVLAMGFANVHVVLAGEEVHIRYTKKKDVLVGRKKVAGADGAEVGGVVVGPHNRQKQVAFVEGQANALLSALGVLDRNDQVRPTMRAKYTQINEFLKLLDHALADVELPAGRELTVLDCGCGSAYLTLAAHHFLNEVKKIPTRVLGIDVNAELIGKCAERAEALSGGEQGGAANLEFLAGKIGAMENARADIVLALHACDTATDDAIVQAVKSGAKLLLAVPCCHKHLNKVLHAEVLTPLHRHGILHQRLADLTTDAFRALVLRIVGYRTEVIEFISQDHTARNLMIRAVKTAAGGERKFVEEYREMKAFFEITPYLEGAMGEVLAEKLKAVGEG